MAQLSMDGPSVNWLLLDLLKKQLEQQDLPKLLNIGSCNLHVIHSSFKSVFQSVEWNIGKLMKTLAMDVYGWHNCLWMAQV